MFFGSKKPDAPQAGQTPQPTNNAAEIIFDVGTDDFEARVIHASMQVPVIVDFWAPWCGPCKQLMPTLEKAVTELGGKALLAKVNIDEHQQLAAALRVQSVPTVFAFFQGKPVDAFQGNVPESQIKAFLGKLIEIARQAMPEALDISEALKGAAQALSDNDPQTAHAIYTQILQEDQENIDALSGMVRTFIAAGQPEQAQTLIGSLPETIKNDSKFSPAITALELATNISGAPTDGLEEKLVQNPDDHQARFDLAEAQFANGQREQAIDHMLVIIEKKRDWNEEAARKQLLKYFEALGHADPLTMEGRKKLSSILFS